MAKKLLVISFFFPPSSKAGAHRAVSLAQFLPRFGWEPVFIAPHESRYFGIPPRIDYKLNEIVRPFAVYNIPLKTPFQRGEEHLFARVTRKLLESSLPPDSRIVWNLAIKKRLAEIINTHDIKAVFISATPFSSFLLAPHIKKEFKLPVILDYRDPWSGNYEMKKTLPRRLTNLRFELQALKHADLVTTASYRIIDFIKDYLPQEYKTLNDYYPLPYGFDKEFFDTQVNPLYDVDHSVITGTFAGSVHGEPFVDDILKGINLFVSTLSKKNELKINTYGTLFGISQNANKGLIQKYALGSTVNLLPYVSYDNFLRVLRESHFLIMPHGSSDLARTLYPTKFFDYLGVRRPILYIGKEGQVWETISELGAGVCVTPNTEDIANGLEKIIYQINNFYNFDKLTRFDRNILFYDFCKRLNCLKNDI